MQSKVETITPAIATELLKRNTRNRGLSKGVIERYARDMREGRWQVNGEALIIGVDGGLLNGQHRLYACIAAGVAFQSFVTRGVVSEGAFDTIDQGRPRTHADIHGMRGELNTALLSATIKWVWRFFRMSMTSALSCSMQEERELLEQNPDVRNAVTFAANRRLLARTLLAPSVVAFSYWCFNRQDSDMCKLFFDMLSTGINLRGDDPIYALRERLYRAGKTLHPYETLALVCKAWNYTKAGKRITVLIWRQDEPFPNIWDAK
jgi:hypothetical protein